MRSGLIAVCVSLVFAGSLAAHAQSGWKPERNVEVIVGSSAGTGTDRVARLMEQIWREQKALGVPVIVVNRPGGGGAVSWAYLSQRAGDPHHLLITSYNIVANYINGTSKLTYTDFTLISLLASEYIAYSVRADSPYKSISDLTKALKADPGSVVAGVSSSAGGANHIAIGRLAKAAGVDLRKMKVVVFSGSGQAISGLLGGHVDLFVNSLSATASPFQNMQLRPLAVAAPKRAPGIYATVPTLIEAGIPIVAENWRLAIAPKGLSNAQADYWDVSLKKLTASDEWEKELAKHYIPNEPLDRKQTNAHIEKEFKEIKSILTDLGLARMPAP
ncbi:MAG: tripartite tricarboxylate transporter substrate binding protein [Burkholderiales bacterium]|nr:tripartite tricarboxylate transporter substrate binding protein [Burkholderiales bacterium]MDP2397736.1 tripartite tricarboxylate transporter substrate binding protein [Burkholderiales bacterium]